jgi:hypothetical protein
MILWWRGWGLLAIVALFLPLASCAGLLDVNVGLALACGGVALLAGGIVCRHFGRRWNAGGTQHSLYEIPLQHYFWPYVIVGLFFALGGIAGLIKKGL